VKELEEAIGEPYANGIDESMEGDENRARFLVRLLESRRPNVVTAYFTALDHEQHETGPFSTSDFRVLERIDAIIGRLLEAAARVGGGRAFVAVVSDHGFEPIDRDVNLRTAFRSAGLLTFAEEGADKPSDWRATVWTNGSSAAVMLKDPADSRTRADVKALLARLSGDPASGIRHVLEGEPISKLGGYPDASFVIDLQPGFQFGSRTTGALVTQRRRGGMHGYLPDNPNMRASFFLLGPGIKAGASLGEIDMRDVGPTLAALIGLNLPAAEGRALPVKR
jgi:predicted AlkP superfamily pyrophosphatase or phosphodiesterase